MYRYTTTASKPTVITSCNEVNRRVVRISCAFLCTRLWCWLAYLFAIVGNRRQNGAQGFHAHGDVQQMGGEEEVVVMSQQRHEHVPDQVQEGLNDERHSSVTLYLKQILYLFQ